MTLIKVFCLFIVTSLSIISSAQLDEGAERVLKLKANTHGKDNCENKVKRVKKETVFLLFYNFVQDTLSVFVEDSLITRGYVNKDTLKVSSDFTGTVWQVKFPKKRTWVTVRSKNENVKVQVRLKRKFPVYMVSLYNGKWIFTSRECFPNSK